MTKFCEVPNSNVCNSHGRGTQTINAKILFPRNSQNFKHGQRILYLWNLWENKLDVKDGQMHLLLAYWSHLVIKKVEGDVCWENVKRKFG